MARTNPQMRTLIWVFAFAVGSVMALGWMAKRYARIVEVANAPAATRPAPTAPPADVTLKAPLPTPTAERVALDAVDRWLLVRGSLARALAARPVPTGGSIPDHRVDELRGLRDRECQRLQLPVDDYRRLTADIRRFLEAEDSAAAELPAERVSALQKRRAEVAAARLERLEAFDL